MPGIPQKELGIRLGIGDLAEIKLRRIHAKITGGDCTSMKAMSFPRHKVLGDPVIQDLIGILENGERVRVDVRKAHTIAPSHAGNVVVYPKDDGTVIETVRRVNLDVLDPVLQLFSEGVVPISSVTVLPNTSAGKPKGIIIETKRGDDKWWRSLQGLNWSFGRGLRVVSLGMNADEFIDKSEDYLSQTLKLARTFPRGSLKYVQFLHDADGQMYMAVAGGPSYLESEGMRQTLAKTPKKRNAVDLIQENNEMNRLRRDRQIAAFVNQLGVPQQELLTDSPYIDLDLDQGTLFSGATKDAPNGLVPFTVGTSGIILHVDNPETATPIGTKLLSYPKGFAPMVPTGVQRHQLSNASDVLFDTANIRDYIAGFSHPLDLQALALGFQVEWA